MVEESESEHVSETTQQGIGRAVFDVCIGRADSCMFVGRLLAIKA